MNYTSIILVIDKYFEDQEIILENLHLAESSVELLVYNNNGTVSEELKALASRFEENKTAVIEYSFSECVNKMLPLCSGEYICILYNYAYFQKGWLSRLIHSYNNIINSGIISLNFQAEHDQCYLLNKEDDLEPRYFKDNKVDGMMFFSKQILSSLGALSCNVHNEHCMHEYCFRAGLIGKNNYYLIDDYSVTISHYTGSYVSNKRQLAQEIKSANVFKILNNAFDHSAMIQALKDQEIESFYSKQLGKLTVIEMDFSNKTIGIIQQLCEKHGYDFQILGTGYYEDYIFKSRVGIFFNKIL